MARVRTFLALALLLGGCGLAPSPATVEAPAPKAATPALQAGASTPSKDVSAKVQAAATASVDKSAPPKAAATKPQAPAKAAAASSPVATAPSTTSAARPAAAAPLDLKALEQRLKDTGAIGVLTKLSLKNQVDDLVGRFRSFHAGQRPPTLAQLRPDFELLLMKVLSLLQDHDSALARDIDASRDALWSVLADRDKFTKLT